MENRKIKVSVVVTVLNEEGSIKKLVNSLLLQSLKPDEIIIIDGSRVGNTGKRISKNRIVQTYIKEGNRSVGRNYGISKARGEIIAVTDAGGYPDKKWLEKIVFPFVDKSVEVVSGYYKSLAITPFEKCITPYFLTMPDKLYKGMEFLPSSRSVAFRKGIWKKVGGYPEEYSHNEDLVFDYNLKKIGISFYFEPNAIVYWNPPKTLFSSSRQMYRFAYGDVEAGIDRPKIKYIYIRYLIGLFLLVSNQFLLFELCFLLYIIWCVQKNFRYAKMIEGLFWLPVIQICSDLAVMAGYLSGKIKNA